MNYFSHRVLDMPSRQTVIEKEKFNVFIIEGNEKLNN